MSQILSQEEVDALLRGIAGGDVETAPEEIGDLSGVAVYDLTSQDRIIRGRMPTLEMTNERFARLFRTSLSGMLRKVVNVTAVSVDMIKFGEFLKTLPVPTSLHIFRMEPLRGSVVFVVESKVIFTLVDILFGGSGKEFFKIEGREFTAIESNLIRKVVMTALADLEKAWKPLADIKVSYQRSEVNPQFAHVVPLTDVVVVVNLELEVEYNTGILSICIPYATVEPIKEKLQAGFQSDQLEVDHVWNDKFRSSLNASQIEILAELGRTQVHGKELVSLKTGDIIPLEQYASDPLKIYVEGVLKFRGAPGVYKGNQAVQISQIITGKEVVEYGTE